MLTVCTVLLALCAMPSPPVPDAAFGMYNIVSAQPPMTPNFFLPLMVHPLGMINPGRGSGLEADLTPLPLCWFWLVEIWARMDWESVQVSDSPSTLRHCSSPGGVGGWEFKYGFLNRPTRPLIAWMDRIWLSGIQHPSTHYNSMCPGGAVYDVQHRQEGAVEYDVE